MVMICHYSKWVEIFSIKNMLAVTVARCLFTFVCRHGVPERILSDQGHNYESELFRELCELLDIHKLRTTPWHPIADGLSERFNRTILGPLKIFVNEKQDNWDEYLDSIAFAYNTSVHNTINVPLFLVVYGRLPKLPIDLIWPCKETEFETNPKLYARQVQHKLCNVFKYVDEQREFKINKFKFYADRDVRTLNFIEGDRVAIKEPKLTNTGSHKLNYKWRGPYTIVGIQTIDDGQTTIRNFKIKPDSGVGKKCIVVSGNRLKKLLVPAVVSNSNEVNTSRRTSVNLNEEDEVQNIVEVRNENGSDVFSSGTSEQVVVSGVDGENELANEDINYEKGEEMLMDLVAGREVEVEDEFWESQEHLMLVEEKEEASWLRDSVLNDVENQSSFNETLFKPNEYYKNQLRERDDLVSEVIERPQRRRKPVERMGMVNYERKKRVRFNME